MEKYAWPTMVEVGLRLIRCEQDPGALVLQGQAIGGSPAENKSLVVKVSQTPHPLYYLVGRI